LSNREQRVVNWVKGGQLLIRTIGNRRESWKEASVIQAVLLPMWILPATSCKRKWLLAVSGFLRMLWVALASKRVEARATHSILLMPSVGESRKWAGLLLQRRDTTPAGGEWQEESKQQSVRRAR
jgi:hypothetical protein